MAIFAQPTADMNLVPGWDVQGNGSGGNPGPDAPGYGEPGNTGAVYGPGQPGAGFPNPPQAEDVGGENSGSYGESVLVNPGYADATGPGGRTLPANIGGTQVTAPTMTTATKSTNPTNLVATVTNSIPGDVSAVSIKDAGGNVVSTTVTGSGVYIVPPGGSITPTFSGGTWTWAV